MEVPFVRVKTELLAPTPLQPASEATEKASPTGAGLAPFAVIVAARAAADTVTPQGF